MLLLINFYYFYHSKRHTFYTLLAHFSTVKFLVNSMSVFNYFFSYSLNYSVNDIVIHIFNIILFIIFKVISNNFLINLQLGDTIRNPSRNVGLATTLVSSRVVYFKNEFYWPTCLILHTLMYELSLLVY